MSDLPQIPALDFVLGLASAVLLVLAAFYLSRSRSSDRTSVFHQTSADAESRLFTEISPDLTGNRLSLIGSLFAHILVVALMPAMEVLLPGPSPFDLQRYDLIVLQYEIPNPPMRVPLDLEQAVGPHEPKLPKPVETTGDDTPVGVPNTNSEKSQPAKGPSKGPVFSVKVRPQNPTNPALLEVVVESDVAIELPTENGNPLPMLLWSSQQPSLSPPPPQRWKGIDSPESPQYPAAAALSDLPIAASPVVSDRPALPVLPARSWPEGSLWKAVDGLGGVASFSGGEGTGGSGSPGGDGGGLAARLLLQAALQQGSLAELLGNGSEGSWGGSGADEPFRAGSADSSDAEGWGRGRLKPVPRKMHGIILISNSFSTLPEAEGVLTGNPVYTVYIEVPDAPRKWVFQVCVPQSNSHTLEYEQGVIRFLPRRSLNPPFALHKEPLQFQAADSLGKSMPSRVVVYASVDEEGNLKNMRMVRGADPDTDDLVLANLRSWEFLPAFRDGEPVAVEALFGIPLY